MNRVLRLDMPSRAARHARRLAAIVMGLLALCVVTPAMALVTCMPVGGTPPVAVGNWNTITSPGSASAGSTISSRQFTSTHSLYHTTATDILIVVGAQGKVDSNSYYALPLAEMPGVGVRVTALQATPSNALQVKVNRFGTPISNITSYMEIYRASNNAMTGQYQLATRYLVELVMLDPSKYKGGDFTFRGSQYLTVTTIHTSPNASSGTTCNGGFLSLAEMLGGTMAVPTLPEPVKPTCSFSTSNLNQTVNMPPITLSRLAASTDARSAGSDAEGTFTLSASNCASGAAFNIYFTDANNRSSTARYLSSSGQATAAQVGMRLYAGSETTAVNVGPAPTGNLVPGNVAAQGRAYYSGMNLGFPFTAQYVRLPGVSIADVVPASVQTRAVVTVVYP